jgi:hypothetical protein
VAAHRGIPEEEFGSEVTRASDRRLLWGFLLAPLAAPAAYAGALVAIVFWQATFRARSVGALGDLVTAVASIGVPLAYAAAFFGGAPAYFFLRAFGIVSAWTLWLTGAALGAVVALLIRPMLRGDLFSLDFPWWVGGLLGVVSAEAFRRFIAAPTRARGTDESGML